MKPVKPVREECSQGLRQLEGYLLWEAESAAARAGAEEFADRLPWLTGAQREEVVRICTADRLEVSRAVIHRIADRARELQGEYSTRYRTLKIRLLALFLTAAAGLGVVHQALPHPG